MDELDISGKRFISSKRAAKENRYHVDYIGQLIRGGKIVGSKVGRTWYVDAESLAVYLGKEYVAAEKKVVPEANEQFFTQPDYSNKASHAQKNIESFSGLTYLSDDEPLVSVFEPEEENIVIKRHFGEESFLGTKVDTQKKLTKVPYINTRSSKTLFVGAILALSVFIIALGASYLLSYTATVQGTQNTASVTFTK